MIYDWFAGCDPDSSWNVYIAQNHFSTGDDCIAIKSGRDWSGRMVNISTTNVLAEYNYFEKGQSSAPTPTHHTHTHAHACKCARIRTHARTHTGPPQGMACSHHHTYQATH